MGEKGREGGGEEKEERGWKGREKETEGERKGRGRLRHGRPCRCKSQNAKNNNEPMSAKTVKTPWLGYHKFTVEIYFVRIGLHAMLHTGVKQSSEDVT